MDPFLGEIKFLAFNWAPKGYAVCNGATLLIAQNPALYSLLGNSFGAPNAQSFNLPDLRGRTIVGAAVSPTAPSPTYKVGDKAGSETVSLSLSQIPRHTHSVGVTDVTATKAIPTGNLFANSVPQPGAAQNPPYGAPPTDPTKWVALAPESISSAGGSKGHQNIQPSLALQACIALVGTYPPRQ